MRKKTQKEYIVDVAKKNLNVEVIGTYINDTTKIPHKCRICGYKWDITPSNVLCGRGCPVCYRHIIGHAPEYKNSIWASKYRKLAEYYGITEEQMKTIMPHSKQKITLPCPNCGYKKNISMDHLFDSGFGCNKCSDGISYPEKFMMSLLDQLHIRYNYQYYPDWIDNKRYDFYLPDYNCIIETHGGQHYEKNTRGRTLQEEQENDIIKEQTARNNGIKSYIVIDCRKSELNWIKDSIIKSCLLNMLNYNESNIDWIKCNMDAMTSKIKMAADLWNDKTNKTIGDIATIMNVCTHSILHWLKKANISGLCDYTAYENRKRKNTDEYRKKQSISHIGLQAGEKHPRARAIECIENREILWGAKAFQDKYGISRSNITACCKGRLKTAGGYHWRYADETQQNNLENQ